MKEEEQLVEKEWFAQAKRAIGATTVALFVEKRHQLNDSAEVQKARSLGLYEYTRQICDRLQAEHPGKAILNRCSECQRIVFTPEALQCFWCGHDWHPKADHKK
jgi:hypothetical protein